MPLKTLSKLTLAEVARDLAIHPFDLIRILVAENCLPESLRFEADQLDTIAKIGGIETWWTDDVKRSEDEVSERALLRDVCDQFVNRSVVGANSTRLDNVLRGLDTEDQITVRVLVQQLVSMGHFRSTNTAKGLFVAVVEGREYAIADLAEGGDVPAELADVWA